MLKALFTERVLFYLAGGFLLIAMIAQGIVAVSLKRLSSAAQDMGKSNHSLMKLLRAKYEHACMAHDKVQNVKAFVDKYVYEYRVCGLRLYSWRRMKMICTGVFTFLCVFGAFGAYSFGMVNMEVAKYLVYGAIGTLFMTVLHLLMDEEYRLKAAKVYMVDFLGNTYAHRYEKEKQKVQEEQEEILEEPVLAASASAVREETEKVVEEKRESFDSGKEARIRKILGEFLT